MRGLISNEEQIYNVKLYRGKHYQGSAVVTVFGSHERSVAVTHVLSADLGMLEVVARAAATGFGLQANVHSVGELVQRRLDELIADETKKTSNTSSEESDA
jgi:hypothetical protein